MKLKNEIWDTEMKLVLFISTSMHSFSGVFILFVHIYVCECVYRPTHTCVYIRIHIYLTYNTDGFLLMRILEFKLFVIFTEVCMRWREEKM